MSKLLLFSLCLVACAAQVLADDKKDDKKDDKAKKEPILAPVELSVRRQPDSKVFEGLTGGNSVRVEFALAYPGKQLLRVDSSSKITSIADDKGNSLLQEKDFFPPNFYGSQTSRDRSSILVSTSTNKVPGKGAFKVRVKGEVVLVVGADEKTEETKKLKFEAKTTAKAGDLSIKVTAEKGMFGAEGPTFEVSGKSQSLKSVEVKDADGKAAEAFQQSWFSGGDDWTHQYALRKPLKEGKIIVTYFAKQEKVKVPVDLSFGIAD